MTMHLTNGIPTISPARFTTRGHRFAASLLVASSLAFTMSAADCKLGVDAHPNVLYFGETAQINVFAHFPTDAYAFASSEVDVFSTDPTWDYASAGAIVGNNVLGINVGQDHFPQTGVLADPSNPIRIWAGLLTPAVAGPAFVQVQAIPTAFEYYPSALTSSTAPCTANGGEDWIFVDPLYLGKHGAAPGRGTSLNVSRSGFIAESAEEKILIGHLLPAIQKVRAGHVQAFNGMTLQMDTAPEMFLAKAKVPAEAGAEADTFGLQFLKGADADAGYEVHSAFPLGVQLGIQFLYKGEVTFEYKVVNSWPLLRVDRIPDVILPDVEASQSKAQRSRITSLHVSFDAQFHGGVNVLFGDGSVRFLSDSIIVYSGLECQNNLKQIGLAAISYESTGARTMQLSPR